jgi:20S proteasome alpha/beta subunit
MVLSSVEKIVEPTSETLCTISGLTDDNDQFVVVAT